MALCRNKALGVVGSAKAYQRFYAQFSLNCNKGYGTVPPAPLLVNCVAAKPVNRTVLAILAHPKLPANQKPRFGITVTFGDDDIYGDSSKYTRQRYPRAAFITIPVMEPFPMAP